MKKIMILAALTGFVFASCTNSEEELNEVSVQKEMSFVPVAQKGTRANYLEGTDFYYTEVANLHSSAAKTKWRDMKISAYLYPQSGEAGEYFVGNTFYNEVAVNKPFYNYVDGGTPTHQPIYWPIGGKLDFLAYSTSEEPTSFT